MFNASLRKGVRSWAAEYIDVFGGYESYQELEFLESLEDGVGDNGKMNFIDSNQNGVFDEEDYFEVFLDRPEEETAVLTYLLQINPRDRPAGVFGILTGTCHMIMTSRGLLQVMEVPDPRSTAFDFGFLEIDSEYSGVNGITTELVVAELWSPPLPLQDSGCSLSQGALHLECGTLKDGEVASEGNVSISFDDANDDGFLDPGDTFIVTGLANWTNYEFHMNLVHGDIILFSWTTGIGNRAGDLPIIDWAPPLAIGDPFYRAFELRIERMYGVHGVKFGDPDEFFLVDIRLNGAIVLSSHNLTLDFNYTSAELDLHFVDTDRNGFINSGDSFMSAAHGPVEVEIELGYVRFPKVNSQPIVSWPVSWQTS
jgi:hypothetical protein